MAVSVIGLDAEKTKELGTDQGSFVFKLSGPTTNDWNNDFKAAWNKLIEGASFSAPAAIGQGTITITCQKTDVKKVMGFLNQAVGEANKGLDDWKNLLDELQQEFKAQSKPASS